MLECGSPQNRPQFSASLTRRPIPDALPTRSCQPRATNDWLFQDSFLNRAEFSLDSGSTGQFASRTIGNCVWADTPKIEFKIRNSVAGGSEESALARSEMAD